MATNNIPLYKRIIFKTMPPDAIKLGKTLLKSQMARIQDSVYKRFFYNAFRYLAFNEIDGDYAEFGSCSTITFAHAYHQSRKNGLNTRLWSFDSFQGFPAPRSEADKHPRWPEGTMNMSLEQFYINCRIEGIPKSAYEVVPGFYEETLDKSSSTDKPANIGLAYIDCDMHTSTTSVIHFLMPRLKHGMIIAFDDYFCPSRNNIAGERRAIIENFGNNPRWNLLPYIQYGWHGMSFIVEDKKYLPHNFTSTF